MLTCKLHIVVTRTRRVSSVLSQFISSYWTKLILERERASVSLQHPISFISSSSSKEMPLVRGMFGHKSTCQVEGLLDKRRGRVPHALTREAERGNTREGGGTGCHQKDLFFFACHWQHVKRKWEGNRGREVFAGRRVMRVAARPGGNKLSWTLARPD